MSESRPPILIVRERVERELLESYTRAWFGDFVKVAVDVERRVLALGGELHADGEELLLAEGSQQTKVWGANVFPFRTTGQIRHTAVMNIRGTRNPGVEVQSAEVRDAMSSFIRNLLPLEGES